MILLIAYLMFAFVLAVDLFTDYRLITKGKSPDHLSGAMIRILALVVPAWLLAGWHSGILLWLFHFAALFWLLFDPVLNRLCGKGWLSVGYSSALDRFFRSAFLKPGWPLLITKMILLVFSVLFLTTFHDRF